MKATVTWASPDGTMQNLVITGHRISHQMWDGGRAFVAVYDKRGRRVRVVSFAQAAMIDKDQRRP